MTMTRIGKMKNKNIVLAGHDFGFGSLTKQESILTQGAPSPRVEPTRGAAIAIITKKENCTMEKKKKGCKNCVGEKAPQAVTPEKSHNTPYYNIGKIEVIDVIEDWCLGFSAGNAIKYIARHTDKEASSIHDIEKAIWYLQRCLTNLKKTEIK
jgi:hypothetical protein